MPSFLALFFFLNSGLAEASTFPVWAQCSENQHCVAIPGICREWDYVNRQSMGRRLKANAERRQNLPCVGVHDLMREPPVAACFHGLCTNALDIETPEKRCPNLRERLEFAFTLANHCETHDECERGLAHCADNCEFRVYPKKAKPSLAAWQSHWIQACASNPTPNTTTACKKTCIDPAPYTTDTRGVRCVQNKCIFPKLKTQIQPR